MRFDDFLRNLWQTLSTSFRLTAITFAVVAAIAAAVLLMVTLPRLADFRRRLARGFWPPQRRRDVPWTFLDLCVVLLAFFGLEILILPFFWQAGKLLAAEPPPVLSGALAPRQIAEWAGFSLPAGPMMAPLPPATEGLAGLAGADALRTQRVSTQRWVMIGLFACRAATCAFVFLYLRMRTGALPLHLLLPTHEWRLDLWRGWLVWFLVTLPLYFLFMLLLLMPGFVGESTPHSVEVFLALKPTLADQLLVALLTVIVSPAVEELLLRGIMQPLFIEEPLLADSLILMSLLMAIGYGLSEPLNPAWAWGPVAFLALVGPGYLAFERLTRRLLPQPGAARGIFATALLFGLMHYSVWPSPVPIFFLGLALGWLAYRTQSIVGCFLAHALFNAVSMLTPVLAKL